jgi:methylated-DNA-protein-cysteine methyltransferase-like protein
MMVRAAAQQYGASNMRRMPANETYQRIYRVVDRIPRGRVATYGQIAQLAGVPGHARQVGYALHSLPDGQAIAWHRVINAKGEISVRSDGRSERLQRALLEREGVEFDDAARISLHRFRWRPQPHRNPSRKDCSP